MYSCNYCGQTFSNSRGLSAHKGRVHKQELLKEKARIVSKYYDDTLDITTSDLLELRKRHSGRCDVCGKVETSNTRPDAKSHSNNLCVDHDHKTKEFRGFLCVQCNRNFGWYDRYKDKIHEHEQFLHRGIEKDNKLL